MTKKSNVLLTTKTERNNFSFFFCANSIFLPVFRNKPKRLRLHLGKIDRRAKLNIFLPICQALIYSAGIHDEYYKQGGEY